MSLNVDVFHRVGDFELTARFVLDAGLTVLFGPSGAGKTRLLRLIAGLDRPLSGSISLDTTVFTSVAPREHLDTHLRRIGMMTQQPYLLPHRTCLGNVMLAVPMKNRAARRARALQLLEHVDASTLAGRHPGALSGGQRQQIALARALAGHPRLLLLDEPFSSLDRGARARLGTLVREVVDSMRLPTLFVTHDVEEVQRLADDVLVATSGDIRRLVTREEALRELRSIDPPGAH